MYIPLLFTHMCWAWAWYSLPSLSPVSTVWESVSVVSSVPVLSVELGLVPDLMSGLNDLDKMKRVECIETPSVFLALSSQLLSPASSILC